MNKRNNLWTKALAIGGTCLVWLTLLAPLFFWLVFTIRRGLIDLEHFDYLLPAELFPVALVGGGLLVWAALRVRRYIKLVVGSLSLAIGVLVGGQVLAVVTGLASSETEAGGWEWAVVLGSIVIYNLLLVVLGAGGARLVRGR
jgi:hypothetical protein